MRRVFALSLASLLAACGSEGMDGEALGPDAAIDEVEDDSPVPLTIDAVPASTPYGAVPVTGRGPAFGSLHYSSPERGQFEDTIGADGTFCVDVPLAADRTNRITFEAADGEGRFSDAVTVEVIREGTAPASGGDDGLVNVARGSLGFAHSVSVEEGGLPTLVDGALTGAYVSLRNANINVDWLAIDLSERRPVDHIRLRTTDDCPLDDYTLFLSDLDNDEPVFHRPCWGCDEVLNTEGGWVQVYSTNDGSADEIVTPTIGGAIASRFGIQFRSRDCGPLVGSGRHRITEIEVWALGDGGEVDPEAPSCRNLPPRDGGDDIP